jgi:small-conductance mechanosensitive channel
MLELLKKPLFYISETNYISLWQIIMVIILIVSAWIFSKLITKKLLAGLFKRTNMAKDSIVLVQKIIFFAMIIAVTLLILSFLGIPLTAFAFISGGVAIGFGFGAKVIIENYLSGWILMSERPIRTGDVIDTDGNIGRVVGIGNRSTTIKRNDGAHMVIPNSQILESKLINLTLMDPYMRTFVRIGVAYGSDIELVRKLLYQVAETCDQIIQEPLPLVVFEDFGDNALIFDLFFWVSIDSGKELREVRSNLRFEISNLFNQNNIVIAFPQRDVHLFLPEETNMSLQRIGKKHE